MPANSISGETSLLACRWPPSHCVLSAERGTHLCVHFSCLPLIKTPGSHHSATLMTSFNLNHLLNWRGNGNPLHYSCLDNSMDRGAWWAIVHGAAKESDTAEQVKRPLKSPVSNIVTCGFKTSTYQFGRDRIQCTFSFISWKFSLI